MTRVGAWPSLPNSAKLATMKTAQAQINELFKALPIEDQRDLLFQLSEAVEGEVSCDDLSGDEVAAIEEGIAQAERGEVVDADEVFTRLAAKFKFSGI